jgi:hypothetical protein
VRVVACFLEDLFLEIARICLECALPIPITKEGVRGCERSDEGVRVGVRVGVKVREWE